MAVREVAAVVQLERENLVARVEQREVHCHVRLRAGVGLDVDVVGPPQLRRAVDGELLDRVRVFTPAVVARTGVPLRVLVRQRAALRFHHCRRHVILRGDHRQRVPLARHLVRQCLGHLGIGRPDSWVFHTH